MTHPSKGVTFTVYVVFRLFSRKMRFPYCQRSAHLSQYHSRQESSRLKSWARHDQSEPLQPRATVSLPSLSLYFILCVFLKNKGVLLHELGIIMWIRKLNIDMTPPSNPQSIFKPHPIPVMSFTDFSLSHAFCCPVSLTSLHLELLWVLVSAELIFEGITDH